MFASPQPTVCVLCTQARELFLHLGHPMGDLLSFPQFVDAYDTITHYRKTGRVPRTGEALRQRAGKQESKRRMGVCVDANPNEQNVCTMSL